MQIAFRVSAWFVAVTAAFIGVWVALFGVAFLLAGDIYDYQDTADGAELPDVDAVVCLAGARGRIAAAGDTWYRYWERARGLAIHPETGEARRPSRERPPILYLSGMGPLSSWGSLSLHLRRGVSNVVRPQDVIIESESLNTDANARWLARFARERGWKSILLMTSPYHMKRARFIVERVLKAAGHEMRVETLTILQEPFEPGEWRTEVKGIRVTLFEYVKWLYYQYFWEPDPKAA
jgi:uncharacterized SAM-binding protein YcdF (DUF218 family)